MSDTTITVLTPPGVGAIAVLSLAGPDAWSIIRASFSCELPAEPESDRVWVGRFGESPGDEVVLCATSDAIEIQCHGGHRVCRWLVEQCVAAGAVEVDSTAVSAMAMLPRALTVRTAAIILDQLSGTTGEAARFADIGRHLTVPWRVVVAGPPNAGKSSLVNALAGYARTVVSPVVGTTRDATTVSVAFDGWPIELIDTAGIRATSDDLESAGVAAALAVAGSADLVMWVTAADEAHVDPPEEVSVCVRVRNKCDLAPSDRLAVSAITGVGLTELIDEIVHRLVPEIPSPGVAVELPSVTRGHNRYE